MADKNGIGRLWRVVILIAGLGATITASGVAYVVHDSAIQSSNVANIETLKEGLRDIKVTQRETNRKLDRLIERP